jgi:hypothetical protein
MKLNRKIIVSIFFIGFLGLPLMMAANTAANPVLAQNPDTIMDILSGGEALFTYIDAEGRPVVAYGQVGFPGTDLDLTDQMYDGCLLMALLSIKGETLDYLLNTLGSTLFGGDSGGGDNFTMPMMSSLGYNALQFGDGGGFDINSILDTLGDTFSLLITVYVNIDEATSNARVSQVLSHLSAAPFGFTFSELLHFPMDEETVTQLFGEGAPITSINFDIQRLETPATQTIESVLGFMNDDGLLGSIDTDKFTDADGSAAALVAIPDIEELTTLFGGIGGEGMEPSLPYSQFALSQDFNFTFDEPIAIAGAGYIDEQYLESGDTDLSIGDLVGATSFVPLPDGHSIVLCGLPPTTNITGITPDDPGLTYYEPEGGFIFWNASGLGTQPDYIVHFNSDEFPPMITVTRSFDPAIMTSGGEVEVTITVTNDGDQPITNVTVDDSGIQSAYPNLDITGSLTQSIDEIASGDSETIDYTINFENEGGYAFLHGSVNYTYDSKDYTKKIADESYVISSGLVDSIMNLINESWPYSGMALGIVGLGAVINIALAARGRGGGSGGTYQV